MFKLGKKGGGNKYTFLVIVLIVIVIYVLRLISPQKEAEYPDTIRYNNVGYVYVETVKSSPAMFVRQKSVSEEGYIVLGRRGVSILDEIYIYQGYRKYRRYEIMEE